jgi:glycosidase
MVERIVSDTGIDGMLRSWIYLDNHDTPRLASVLPDSAQRRVAQLLQFTLPGCASLYYGSELELRGGEDPENRAPMPWERVDSQSPELQWTRRLTSLRKSHRALRVGDFRTLETDALLGFERFTERAADSIFVLANPSDKTAHELVLVPESRLLEDTPLFDLLNPEVKLTARSGLLDITVPARTVRLLKADLTPCQGYNPYKHIR